MKTSFIIRHIDDEKTPKQYFEEKASKLLKHTKRFKDELVYLHGTLEKNPHREEFYATLSLFLPTVALHCREKGTDFALALSFAFQDITRQIEKHIDKLNREKRRLSR